MNIYQKIIEIRKNIEGFSKDTKGYNYNYVSGSQVLGKIKSKMEELQVLLIPEIDYSTVTTEIREYDMIDSKSGKEKHIVEHMIKGSMNYTWINAENPEEKIVTPWMFTGQQDDTSKALGSALTYAERYYLLKFFNLPTDSEDPDARQDTKQYTKPQGTISPAQINRAYAIAKSKGLTEQYVVQAVSKLYRKNLNELNRTEYDAFIEKIQSINNQQ